METYRFVSESMAEGLMAVRRQLGGDAVILSVDESERNLIGGRPKVEILATLPQGGKTKKGAAVSSEEDLLSNLYAQETVERASVQRRGVTSQVLPAPQEPRWSRPEADPFDDVDLRETVMSPEISSLYFYLTDSGMDADMALEMIDRLAEKMNPNRPWRRRKIHEFLSQLVMRHVQTGGVLGPSKRRRIAAFIGPTGVGKTTTIAKIAARLMRHNLSIGIVTLDYFRVGAVGQLKKFADAMKIPFLAASNQREFGQAVKAFQSRQMVLIDTAGQNPRDQGLLERLDATLRMAGTNVERHLVLAAPTKERDLKSFADIYKSIGYDYMLFTKVDETVTYGGLLNAYFAARRPFSYFTNGQRVPEDLQEAKPEMICNLLFH